MNEDKNIELTEINGKAQQGNAEVEQSLEASIAELRRENEELKKQRDDNYDRFLRKYAELENYRKRVEKEKAELHQQGVADLAREVLPVLDAIERALDSLESSDQQAPSEAVKSYREGFELIHRQLQAVLAKFGVTPIKAAGEMFDPYYHEALARIESAEHEENVVLEEVQKGYMHRDRVLRPTQVKVAVRPALKEQ